MILTESEKLYSNIEYGFDRKFAWRQSTSFYSQSFGFVQVPVTRKQDRRVVWTSLWFLSLTLFLGLIYIFELNILLSFFLWFCLLSRKKREGLVSVLVGDGGPFGFAVQKENGTLTIPSFTITTIPFLLNRYYVFDFAFPVRLAQSCVPFCFHITILN